MKLCKDCVHYKAGESKHLDKCTRDVQIEPVRGTPGDAPLCIIQRMHYGACGVDGANFEPMPRTCGPETR